MTIKAIILDLNGVLIQSPLLSDLIKEKYNLPPEKFLPALAEIMKIARSPGTKNSYLLWKPYLEKWNIKLTQEEFFNFWFSCEKINQDLLKYLKQLDHKNIQLFILSNNFRERTVHYRTHFAEIFRLIKKSYFSWETGFIKPDIEAYKKILDENDLDGKECIYFDDSQKNLDVAATLRIKSFKYISVAETKRTIEQFF